MPRVRPLARRSLRRTAWPVGLALLLAACTGSRGAAGPTPVELTVFAAASLRDAFQAIAPIYQAERPGVRLIFAFDASSALRIQIEQGAPADAFVSADTRNAQALSDDGLAAGAPQPFVANALTIVIPSGDPARIAGPFDLARPGVRIVAAGEEVPITRYARQVVERLGALPGAPAAFAASVAANTVSREDNVRAVLAKIELGEGDAALVYVTDATASTRVKAIALPPEANVRATYAAVAVKTSPRVAEASAFVAWLLGPAAQRVFTRFGFLPPP